MTEDDRHQEVLDEVIQLASRVVDENSEVIRTRIEQESPWWIPDGRRREDLQARIARHPAAARRVERRPESCRCAGGSTRRCKGFIDRLNTSPEFAARVDAWKEEFLDNDAARRFSAVALAGRQGGAGAVCRQSATRNAPGAIENALTTFGQKALEDPELMAKMDEFVVDVAVFLVARYQDEVADLIASTVAGWDPELTSRRVELAIGRDLQFIRINGTIVGGLAGMLIYLLSSLFP